jgi:hypothetical protein
VGPGALKRRTLDEEALNGKTLNGKALSEEALKRKTLTWGVKLARLFLPASGVGLRV